MQLSHAKTCRCPRCQGEQGNLNMTANGQVRSQQGWTSPAKACQWCVTMFACGDVELAELTPSRGGSRAAISTPGTSQTCSMHRTGLVPDPVGFTNIIVWTEEGDVIGVKDV